MLKILAPNTLVKYETKSQYYQLQTFFFFLRTQLSHEKKYELLDNSQIYIYIYIYIYISYAIDLRQ
jgi:hypothetical protein